MSVNDGASPKKPDKVALLLCLFLGWSGAHRFYARKMWTGILWLLTFGLAGIGWIVDLVIIINALSAITNNPISSGKSDTKSDPSLDISLPFTPIVQITQEYVDHPKSHQRTHGELPMADICGYVSPSGGYVNYASYRVSGINPVTMRINTKVYETQTESTALSMAASDGLIEPFSVTINLFQGPSESQMASALGLGATVPKNSCDIDVSAILDRIIYDDELSPDPGISRYAHECGVRFTRLIGRKALFEEMFRQMNARDRAILYAYAVYVQNNAVTFSDPRVVSAYPAFTRFSDYVTSDPKCLKSLSDRDSDDLLKPNKKTTLYKTAVVFLNGNGVFEGYQ